jgi:uncharacterized membrane protein YdjX (TVP38/TMEM64 family)
MPKKLQKKNNHIKVVAMFAFSIAIIVATFVFQDELAKFRTLGLLGIFIINIFSSVTVFLPAPGIATVVAGGAVFNPIVVGVIAGLGAAIGDMVSFFLGRSGNEILLKNKHGLKYEISKDVFLKYGTLIIFIFALIPNPLFDAIGIIAGIFSYSPRKFFLVMLSARIIRNIILASIGAKI